MITATETDTPPQVAPLAREEALADFRLACLSRQVSLLGRREVLTGKAKFGIFGDGKELAQIALAKAFRPGDFRAGYYRDQTILFALGLLTVQEFFAQLYAHPDLNADPASAGRAMNCHFGTRMLDSEGRFTSQTAGFNVASDISPTAGQMPKLVGLAYASKLYREAPSLQEGFGQFSQHGDEIAFGTIGNASCAEGLFWEAINAVGVLKAPLLMSVWDDGYGISVPNELQVTKSDVGALLEGFRRSPGTTDGYDLYRVAGHDYRGLVATYREAADRVRGEHVPALVHVVELTQPQGHSTSGSHERYKSPERLAWEAEHDCLAKFRQLLLTEGLATTEELDRIDRDARDQVAREKQAAWDAYRRTIEEEVSTVVGLLEDLAAEGPGAEEVRATAKSLEKKQTPFRRDLLAALEEALVDARPAVDSPARQALVGWKKRAALDNRERYNSDLLSESAHAALEVPVVPAAYGPDARTVNGFEVLNACFDQALARMPNLFALGEDVGRLGDVNQGFLGLQEKYGALRVADTGIREATIMGQAIGMALRGLRPIAEIQYLDYLLYALQILSDDLATLRWRTKSGQKAPVIVRTRGHRLEGVWHSGSPMGATIHLLRGLHVCVPRDMTQAAGMYNTLLQGDDPAIVVEVLNAYRQKELLPDNVGELTVALGVPEVIRPGGDVTIVTYGACCRIVLEATELLARLGIEAEVIDVQTLLPFDLGHRIVQSLEKTARLVIVDEDVPGGASAFILREVLEVQDGYRWLDSPPRTVTSAPHRPAYGSDGDYFSKPNRETIFEAVYELVHEAEPKKHELFFR
jgi:pyruvate/2-oxoglutarate/acetoin dehydrogenase E1 component/TPP-dependent pyruvate/acetoin dehydrogenase alpha subunit